MKAVIMAGGEGTRLRPVGIPLPKPMMPLLGRPVMEHIVCLLRHWGFREICATVRYMPQTIMDYFEDGGRFGVHMEYRVESRPLGTAGGVRACLDFAGGEDFLVISGDAACDFDLGKLVQAHRAAAPAASLAVTRCPTPLQYGLVLTDAADRVVRFIEKPDWSRVVTDRVNTGIYIVSPGIFDSVPPDTACDFGKELFPRLLAQGADLRAVPMEGYWCDIGTPDAYYRCNLDALAGKLRLLTPAPAAPPRPEAEPRQPREEAAFCRTLPCRDRAGLMRALSSVMMEAGADFSDGLSLRRAKGNIRVFPAAGESALELRVDSPDRREAYRLGQAMAGLIRRIEARRDDLS